MARFRNGKRISDFVCCSHERGTVPRTNPCLTPDEIEDSEVCHAKAADEEKFQVDPVSEKRVDKDNGQQDGEQDG